MELDAGILDEILDWGSRIESFQRSHAVDGLTCVQGYVDGLTDHNGSVVPGIGAPDRLAFSLFALDLVWLFWLDDCFDSHIASDGAPVDVPALAAAGTGNPTTPEGLGYYLLAQSMSKRRPSSSELQFWLDNSAGLFDSWKKEELYMLEERWPSYAEYMENGVFSSAVPQILASASIAYELDMASRVGEMAFDRLVRNLSIISRLQNDYYSVEKERLEGCKSNAVLLLESYMTPEKALEFVASERTSYEQMLQDDIDTIGEDDTFCRLAKVMIASQERLYLIPRKRFHPNLDE